MSTFDDGTLARIDALQIFERWSDTAEFPDRMFSSVPPFRRGFVMDLVYTMVRNVRMLSFVVDRFMERQPDKPFVYGALILGAAQILLMPTVAEHAEVFATVEALKALNQRSSAGLVNAVLRNILRNENVVRDAIEKAPIAVRYSHTDEQVARWTKNLGDARAEEICKWDNTPAGVNILSLPGRPTVPELLATFDASGVRAKIHTGCPSRCIVLDHGSHVDKLPGFAEGAFSVQDPATLEAIRLLDVKPSMRVLDACAAPGGKTVQIACLTGESGRVIAMDCWRDRLAPLRENVARFGLEDIVTVVNGDAKRIELHQVGGKRFDRILADVPCSNTGVQRRRADARWRFSAERLEMLASTQLAILSNLIGLLAPGGRIVYSTCSIEPEENDLLIERFLREHPKYELVGKSALIPPDRGCDGAFAAAIQRRE